MSGLTPINTPPSSGVITISSGDSKITGDGIVNGTITVVTGDGDALTYVRPNRMDSLPDTIIAAEIFPRLVTGGDFSVFFKTCRRMYAISCTIPMYAFSSHSLRDFVFTHNTESKGAAIKLIEAVEIEREASFFYNNDGKVIFYNPSPELQNAENIFYTTVKKCCLQLNTKIDCNELIDCFAIATKNVREIVPKRPIMHLGQLNSSRNVGRVLVSLHERVYRDLIDISACQLGKTVTFHTFKSTVKQLKEFFPNIHEVDIEASLRRALRTKYGTAFQQYATESLIAFPTSKMIAEMQQQLIAPLLEEKAAIEAELAVLRGPNGIINAAYMEMKALMNMPDEPVDQAKIDVAMMAVEEASSETFKVCRSSFPSFSSYILASLDNDLPILNMRAKLREAHQAQQSPTILKRKAAEDWYDGLIARLNTLAQWEKDTDILIGGKLFEVCNRINEIGSISLFKVRQRGLFALI